MSQQLVKVEPVTGEITKQEATHSESQQSYAIPGGQTHEATRDASQLVEANIAGGKMRQEAKEHQFQAESESVKKIPGGGVSKTAAQSQQQQQEVQSVSKSSNVSPDGLRSSSTSKTSSRRVVQKSSTVQQSSTVSTSHPSGMPQAMIELPQQQSELERTLQQQQHRMKELEQQTIGTQQLERQADEAVGANVQKQTGSHITQQKTVQTRKVVQEAQHSGTTSAPRSVLEVCRSSRR